MCDKNTDEQSGIEKCPEDQSVERGRCDITDQLRPLLGDKVCSEYIILAATFVECNHVKLIKKKRVK